MPVNVLVPPLSQTMDSLVLLGWLKKIGDPIQKGEPLFQVETDKSTLEVESPADGVLGEVLAEPGAEVTVGSTIGVIVEPAEAAASAPAATSPAAPDAAVECAERERTPGDGDAELHKVVSEQRRIFASPRARQLAQHEGVMLDRLQATGPQNMIVERDVRAFLARREQAAEVAAPTHAAAPSPALQAETEAPQFAAVQSGVAVAPVPAGRRISLSGTRRTIARRMQQSHLETVPVTLTREVDATELVILRECILGELGEGDVRPTYTDLLVSIVSRCLLRHPALNAHLEQDALVMFDEAHVAIAVDTERGLVAPAIRSAQSKGLLELARERSALARRAVEGSLAPDELAGGTFTLTNLGTLGVDTFTPVINLPQVAILGVGRIRAVPAVHDGQVAIRQVMHLSLTFDHRAVDGAPAARLLNDVAMLIEKPHRVWL